MQNYSCENESRLQIHFSVNQNRFHMKGFARGVVLKERYKVTRKLPTVSVFPVSNVAFPCHT